MRANGCASTVHDSTPGRAACQAVRLPIIGPDGKVVAVIVDGVLTKTIDASKHMLRFPPAIALSTVAVAEAERLGVTQIVVSDRESGKVYRATLADLHDFGWSFDRGFGAQLALRLSRWTTDGAATAPAPPAPPAPVVVQLGLWG